MKDERKKFAPVGPFAPPTPSEAEQSRGEPMAVANDKETIHSDSHMPTTASTDAMAPDVARKYRDPNMDRGNVGGSSPTPHGADVASRTDENRRSEEPEGFERAGNGNRRLKDE